MESDTTTAAPSSSPEVHGGKWITQFNESTGDDLIVNHGNAWRLLSWIARKANWKDGFPDNRLKEGQCFVRGCAVVGMTDQEYKTAKHVLGPERFNLVALEKRNKGTLFTLTSTKVFAVNNKVFSRGAKVEAPPDKEQEGATPPPNNGPATPKKPAASTSKTPQPRPISTVEICDSAIASNEQESLPKSEQNHRPETTKPENGNEQPTSRVNVKPSPEARKQRAKPPSVATLPDLDVPDLERSDPSKLRNSKSSPNSKLSAVNYIRENAAGIRFHDDELSRVPSMIEKRVICYAWLLALWKKHGAHMGEKGRSGNWFESFIAQWMERAHEKPGIFRMVWEDTLNAHKEGRIKVSLGAHANDYWLRLEKGKKAA